MLFQQTNSTLHKRHGILAHLGAAEILAARMHVQHHRLVIVVRCHRSNLAITVASDSAFISRVSKTSDPASLAQEALLHGAGRHAFVTISALPDRASHLLRAYDDDQDLLAAARKLVQILASAVRPVHYSARTGISSSALDRLFQGAYLLLRAKSDDLPTSLAGSILLPSEDERPAILPPRCALVFRHILAWHAPTASAASIYGNRFNCRRERLFVFPDFSRDLSGHEAIELRAEAAALLYAFYAEAAADPAIAVDRLAAYRELGLDLSRKNAA